MTFCLAIETHISAIEIFVCLFLFVCLFVICLRRGATACNTSSWDFDPEPLLLICLSRRQKHTTKQFEKGVVLENNPSCTFRLLILFGWIQLHHRECWILNSRAGYILEVLRTLGTLRTLGRLFLNKHRKEVSLVRYDFLSQSVTRKSHHHQIIAKHFTWQLTWWLVWHSQPRERTITGLRLYEAQIWNNWTRYCRRLPSYLSKVGLLAFGSPGWSVFCSFVTMPKLPRLLLQTKIWLLNPSKWSRP